LKSFIVEANSPAKGHHLAVVWIEIPNLLPYLSPAQVTTLRWCGLKFENG